MSFGTLFVSYKDGRLEIVELEKPTIDLGTAPENDVVLHEPQAEALHAQLLCDDSGCQIVDWGSATGTILAGQRLTPDEPAQLTDQAVMQIGDVTLIYAAPTPEVVPQAAQVVRSRRRLWFAAVAVLAILAVVAVGAAVRGGLEAVGRLRALTPSPTAAPLAQPASRATIAPTVAAAAVQPTTTATTQATVQPTTAPTAAATATQGRPYIVTTANQQRLFVRSSPGRNNPEVGQLNAGTVVRVIGEPVVSDGLTWVRIEAEGLTGWCVLGALRPQ